MNDPEQMVKTLNTECKNLLANVFALRQFVASGNLLVYRIEGISLAMNRFDEPTEQVKVQKWFADFWVFMEIKFVIIRQEKQPKAKDYHPQISISVFQGREDDDSKNQLFRAEWDDFQNDSESHSQPHWHVTSYLAIERTFDEYARVFEKDDFLTALSEEKSKIIDVAKIHFAMNGNWQNEGHHVHKIENEKQVVNWVKGLLSHVRLEFEGLSGHR